MTELFRLCFVPFQNSELFGFLFSIFTLELIFSVIKRFVSE